MSHAGFAISPFKVGSDLTIISDDGSAILVVELRLPDHVQSDPLHMENLDNAFLKAQHLGARWSATCDGAEFVLLDGKKDGPLFTRVVYRKKLGTEATRNNLDVPVQLEAIRHSWTVLIRELTPILRGIEGHSPVPPDELFVESLRAVLASPVAAIRDELSTLKESDEDFKEKLISWMVDDQGWAHNLDEFETEVARVANVSAYVFAVRLLFYEALRRAQPTLLEFDLGSEDSPYIATELTKLIFNKARAESGDYETVFTFDQTCEFSLISPASVAGWRRVLRHLGHFQLNLISYDVLGRLFERLIDPQERYKWGQHYTSPDVADIMLSLAIPDGKGSILDPAAGGGTFLVRGYVRKTILTPDESHQDRLEQILGCDVSAFATSLATVSLASRDLSFSDNYPRVRAGSFFQVRPDGPFLELPVERDLPSEIMLPSLAAVVCNPPYIAWRNVDRERKREAEQALDSAAQRFGVPKKLRGMPNYHLFFWFHSTQFLKEDGRLVFITSGEWLDSDYGIQLQNWLLNNTRIELVLESLAETWFTEARVGTVVLSARRCDDSIVREQNLVRFVTLRKDLRTLYECSPGESDEEHINHVDKLRDRLLSLTSDVMENDNYDSAVVQQQTLGNLGRR